MHVAYGISLMSSCIQRQVGAVVTTPDYGKIISWGYNEVPVYSKPCHIEYKNCYRAINKVDNLKKIQIHFCPFCGEKITGDDLFSAENVDIIETQSGRKVFCKKCHADLYKALSPGKELDLCRSLHAEENAILQNVFVGGGVSLRGMTLYSTTFPCFLCAKKIVNSGIKEVVYVEPYPIIEAMRLLRDSNVELKEFEGVKASAFFKVFRERIAVLNSEIKPLLG